MHHSMSLIGLALASLAAVLYLRPDLLNEVETQALSMLLQRQEARNDSPIPPIADSNPAERASATLPSLLPRPQANIALWLSRKYNIAPEPLSLLVAEAFAIGEKIKLDPTLILAVMAIESRFNPFAQSNHGAQGLMQVMTRIHSEKYDNFGGILAAFDPISNLRVGVKVLQDSIKIAGSEEGGLAMYVGAVSSDPSGYINKVRTEQERIRSAAMGKSVPVTESPTLKISPTMPTVPRTVFETDAARQETPPPLEKTQELNS
jgi:soluble lytic murein transglycosylase-like protein